MNNRYPIAMEAFLASLCDLLAFWLVQMVERPPRKAVGPGFDLQTMTKISSAAKLSFLRNSFCVSSVGLCFSRVDDNFPFHEPSSTLVGFRKTDLPPLCVIDVSHSKPHMPLSAVSLIQVCTYESSNFTMQALREEIRQ